MIESKQGESIFLSLLTILFIGLKLTGFINWSWWWVLCPIWIPLILVILIGGGVWLYFHYRK